MGRSPPPSLVGNACIVEGLRCKCMAQASQRYSGKNARAAKTGKVFDAESSLSPQPDGDFLKLEADAYLAAIVE